jgi:hypothetical protein
LFALGIALVLVLVVGLWQLTRRDPPQAPPVRRAEVARVAPAPAPAVSEPAPTSAPRVAPPRPRPPTPIERAPDPVPAGSAAEPVELKRDANGRLSPLVSLADLRALLPTLEEPMKNCIEHTAPHATGKATLNFTISTKDNKLAVESTGVVDDASLAAFPELVTCLHQSAYMFNVGITERAIPELGNPMVVRRQVQLDNGEIRENAISDFSYQR